VSCEKIRELTDHLFEQRFFIDRGAGEQEVTEADYVAAERSAGFYNTLGHPELPATHAFSSSGLRGRIEEKRIEGAADE
jgi:hypothetical protein